jgi:hypothetical protein
MACSKKILSLAVVFAFGFIDAQGNKVAGNDANSCTVNVPVCPPDVVIPTDKKACDFLSYYDPGRDFKICVDLKNKPEGFYAKNVRRFSDDWTDQTFYMQSTWDLSFSLNYGQAMQSKLTMRNKSRWGSDRILPTTEEQTKIADAVTGTHRHHLGRQMMWIREGWLQFSINDVFGLPTSNRHYFKIGAFPFQLGRGIALGDAYATSPGPLGFYSDDIIDQYAYGILEHGEIFPCTLTYDLYYELARNRSGSFPDTTEQIYNQTLDRRDSPRRGFGSIEQLLAFRFNWTPIKDKVFGKLSIEPYVFGLMVPESKVDFDSDAWARVLTPGIAFSYENKGFEGGFEFAFNKGAQHVRPYDKNIIEAVRDGATGNIQERYSQVATVSARGNKAPVTDSNKAIVDKYVQSFSANGQEILAGSDLFNTIGRYRKGYKNILGGFMGVMDFGLRVINDDFKVVGTAGYASGDQNPNRNLDAPFDAQVDGSYDGFFGYQEIYSGKLVKSVFVIGSQRVPRPLTYPSQAIPAAERFAESSTGFSNIMLVGGGLQWLPKKSSCKLQIKPNALAYWTAIANRKFDAERAQRLEEQASKFLGTEFNIFCEGYVFKGALKLYGVAGVFVPGQFYKDMKGVPQKRDELRLLRDHVENGAPLDTAVYLGDSAAFSLNLGMEYTF